MYVQMLMRNITNPYSIHQQTQEYRINHLIHQTVKVLKKVGQQPFFAGATLIITKPFFSNTQLWIPPISTIRMSYTLLIFNLQFHRAQPDPKYFIGKVLECLWASMIYKRCGSQGKTICKAPLVSQSSVLAKEPTILIICRMLCFLTFKSTIYILILNIWIKLTRGLHIILKMLRLFHLNTKC